MHAFSQHMQKWASGSACAASTPFVIEEAAELLFVVSVDSLGSLGSLGSLVPLVPYRVRNLLDRALLLLLEVLLRWRVLRVPPGYLLWPHWIWLRVVLLRSAGCGSLGSSLLYPSRPRGFSSAVSFATASAVASVVVLVDRRLSAAALAALLLASAEAEDRRVAVVLARPVGVLAIVIEDEVCPRFHRPALGVHCTINITHACTFCWTFCFCEYIDQFSDRRIRNIG